MSQKVTITTAHDEGFDLCAHEILKKCLVSSWNRVYPQLEG